VTSKKLTVLQIIPSLAIGGAERNVLAIAAALVQAGHRSIVISSGGALVDVLQRSGSEHITWNVKSKNPLVIFRNKKRLMDFIQTEKIDIVHAHSRAPAWSAYLATRKPRVPFVTSFHSAYKGTSALKKGYNSVMARGDRVMAASRFLADHVQAQYHVGGDKIALIPLGIDLAVFNRDAVSDEQRDAFRQTYAVPPDTPLFIMPSRLSPIKGHELVLRALHRLGARPYVCLMIGSDQGRKEYRQHLESLVKELNLGDKVRFVDQADLPVAYAAASVVLSPSQVAEGFGLVPVEAQAMGVPVIATAAGATMETVLQGKTGWLVPLGDVKALSAAMTDALTLTPARRQYMSLQAEAHASQHYDIQKMGTAVLGVYDALVNK